MQIGRKGQGRGSNDTRESRRRGEHDHRSRRQRAVRRRRLRESSRHRVRRDDAARTNVTGAPTESGPTTAISRAPARSCRARSAARCSTRTSPSQYDPGRSAAAAVPHRPRRAHRARRARLRVRSHQRSHPGVSQGRHVRQGSVRREEDARQRIGVGHCASRSIRRRPT